MSSESTLGSLVRSYPLPDGIDPAGLNRHSLWSELLDAFGQAAQDVVFDDPRVNSPFVEAEGLRYLCRLFAGGWTSLVEADPAYPQLVRGASPMLNWGLPNPDYDYLWAPLHPDYAYRIYGKRGTTRMFQLETWAGNFSRMGEMHGVASRSHFLEGRKHRERAAESTRGAASDSRILNELEIGPDGEVEIVLSKTEQKGNWLPITEPGWLLLRACYGDWENEEGPDLCIERLDAEYPAPPLTAADLATRVALLKDFLRATPRAFKAGVQQHYMAKEGELPFPPVTMGRSSGYDDQLGTLGQYYGQGSYQCGRDEAVILEVQPPTCPYWHFMLLTHFWEGMDWVDAQTSINCHQAVLDSDGKFRAVISHDDPGVPNWLDTRGHESGLLGGRYYQAESAPIARLETVPFRDLRAALPKDTPAISPAERKEALLRRMRGLQRRQKPGSV